MCSSSSLNFLQASAAAALTGAIVSALTKQPVVCQGRGAVAGSIGSAVGVAAAAAGAGEMLAGIGFALSKLIERAS